MIDRWSRVNEEYEVRRAFGVDVADIAVLAELFLNIFQGLTVYSSVGVVEPIYVDECEFNFAGLLGLFISVCVANHSDKYEERQNGFQNRPLVANTNTEWKYVG
jgi:hypothetical protein